jgi:UDP-2-acetamido-3-amino-2,3-dideoxy-glucuronate N-acetyltransferase
VSDFFIHPSAIVDSGAEIGNKTKVWHFCHLMQGARIGSGCILGQNVFIDNNVIIGNNVKIQNNVSVYNSVTLQDDVFIGPSVVFTNVINPRSFIERKDEFKPTLIKTGASVGANATILCGVTVGEYAMVGAGAVVTRDVLPHEIIAGNPARPAGWISKAGATLDFSKYNSALCSITNQKYILENNKITCIQ